MRRWPIPLLLVVLMFALAAGLQAQEAAVLDHDDLVRITAPSLSPKRLQGRVASLTGDTLVLRTMDTPTGRLLVPLDSITKLEVFQGTGKEWGSFFGLFGGAVVGAGLGKVLVGDESAQGPVGGILVGAFAGGLAGYLVGTYLDWAVFGEDWEEIPVSRIRATPSGPEGPALYVSLRI